MQNGFGELIEEKRSIGCSDSPIKHYQTSLRKSSYRDASSQKCQISFDYHLLKKSDFDWLTFACCFRGRESEERRLIKNLTR